MGRNCLVRSDPMRRPPPARVVLAGVVGVVLAFLAAFAVPVRPASAQEPVTIDVEFGVGSLVAPTGANPVRVNLSADVLVTGELRLTVGRSVVVSQVEIPAGTTKVYDFVFPAVGAASRADVAVVSDGEVVASTRVTLRVPVDQNVIGVFGDPELARTVEEITAEPFAVDLAVVLLDSESILLPFDVVDHLVLAEVPPVEAHAHVASWVQRGGRLQAPAGVLAEMGMPVDSTTTRLGAGTVGVFDPVSGQPAFTSVAPDLLLASAGGQPFNQLDSTLFEAASFGQRGEDLRFGWLAGALVVYIVVVGPLNFFVLSRLGRREWAWITVPVLSVLGVVAFSLAGDQSGDSVAVRHATVLVQTGESVHSETGFVLVTGREGDHRLSFEQAEILTPFDASNWFGGTSSGTNTEIRLNEEGDPEIAFELAALGVGSARATWKSPSVAVAVEGARVTNNSDYAFTRWGLASEEGMFLGAGTLEPGASADIGDALPGNRNGFTESQIADAVFSRFVNESDFQSEQMIWPLSWAATQIDRELLTVGNYFFGFTSDLALPVTTDGADELAAGEALVVVGESVDHVVAAQPELIAAPGADWIEQYGPAFVYGADSVEMAFELPESARGSELRLVNRDGPPLGALERIEVYNWSTGGFDEIVENDGFAGDYMAPAGDVMVRLVAGAVDTEVYLGGLRIEWGPA